MTTLQPRAPYSSAELQQLYPTGLQLQLVQVLLRHGERSPVSARFQNAGLKGIVWIIICIHSFFPQKHFLTAYSILAIL